MKKQLLIALLFTMGFSSALKAQNTIGLISYDFENTYEGYNLIFPHNQSNVFLLNNCGEIVHSWTDSIQFRPGNSAYLLPNGDLLKAKRNASTAGDSIWAGGGGAFVELRDWDNQLLWSFEKNTTTERLHHDIEPLPNGNVMMIVWEKKTKEEAIAAGRNPALLAQGKLWPDYLLEVNPDTDEIVWEWHTWDHLIQDFDATKEHYGVVSEHPELIDINYDNQDGKADWMHVNAVDFNAELNQVMISVPAFNEIWIIDHSTTTGDAAGHTGGAANHGGDLLYRVGNPAAYQKGDSTDQILYFQHDAHWTNEFITFGHPNFGKIVCFNNRVGANYSSVEIFNSSWNMYLGDYERFDGKFPPFHFDNTITHPEMSKIHSTGLSSAQLLPNENIYVNNGRTGYMVELTPENEVAWEYILPIKAGQAATQGDTLMTNDNLNFRAFKYPPTYSAFDGRDLTPNGYIENEPDEEYCNFLIETDFPSLVKAKLFPTIANEEIYLSWDTTEGISIQVVDLLGRTRLTTNGYGGEAVIDVRSLEPNLYFVVINGMRTVKVIVQR